MDNPVPAYEQFGFKLIEQAFGGPPLQPWENDYARIFWQCLEVNNGGFEQWVGNTGKAGVVETLDALYRCSLLEVRRVTKEACDLMQLDAYDGNTPYRDYLDRNVTDWFAKLRVLDEAYWDMCDDIHDVLKSIHQNHVVTLQ